MRISEILNLKGNQRQFDFIDIDTETDAPLFFSPYIVSKCTTERDTDMTSKIKSFFTTILKELQKNELNYAIELFESLQQEPNDYCLGMSTGNPRGRSINSGDTKKILNELIKSKAMSTGKFEDIEDMQIFIDYVAEDKVSDMCLNIVRKELNDYTKEIAEKYGYEMTKEKIDIGIYWCSNELEWKILYDHAFMYEGKTYILIPKHCVTKAKSKFSKDEFYNTQIVPYLQTVKKKKFISEKHKRSESTKKAIKEENGKTIPKIEASEFAFNYPQLYQNFKADIIEKEDARNFYLGSHDELSEACSNLKERLLNCHKGNASANEYENIVADIIILAANPILGHAKKQDRANSGRKRMDITFSCQRPGNVFWSINQDLGYSFGHIVVECKNYSDEISNPEFDQLTGRFSKGFSEIGLLTYRDTKDAEMLFRRSKDIYFQRKGFVIPISDKDLCYILDDIKLGNKDAFNDKMTELTKKISLNN